jgi:hypothetical protein
VITVGDSSFSAIGQRQGALVSQQKLRDEFLKLEIFYSLLESQVVDACRHHYSRIWLHSGLGYRPPAPITLETVAQQLPTSAIVQYPLNVPHPNTGQVKLDDALWALCRSSTFIVRGSG